LGDFSLRLSLCLIVRGFEQILDKSYQAKFVLDLVDLS
jgi:hypothetical protein